MSDKVYTVSEVNHHIHEMFEDDFALHSITISGELSNVKYHGSGHIYFSLKDEHSKISGMMFRSDVEKASLNIDKVKDGDKVKVKGRISTYEEYGVYQIYAKSIEKEDGEGALRKKFELLKKELMEEGMFAEEYKQAIPPYAMKIGIVTADTGAVIHDILRNARRRNPHVSFLIAPAKVQGEGAAESICDAIYRLNSEDLDVIIVCRGGGSFEDLFCFSEECVARAIFASKIPIVTGIGHEPDVSIADYVADKRASTPTAAAELTVFSYDEFKNSLSVCERRLKNAFSKQVVSLQNRLKDYKFLLERYGPEGRLRDTSQKLDEYSDRMERAIKLSIKNEKDLLISSEDSIKRSIKHRLEMSRNEVARLALMLDTVSPVKKLSSGYSYIENESGKNIRTTDDVAVDELLKIYLAKGRLTVTVKEKTNKSLLDN